MLFVGLTGSIAVGKSFVTGVFAELGAKIIDADQVARAVVEPGTPGLRAVVEAFGPEVLHADGTLDRRRLGDIVFHHEERRVLLNSLLHPYIFAAQDEEMKKLARMEPNGICLVDAALMIETGSYRRFDKLIVVFCQPELQIERLIKRDHLTAEEARRRIATQMPQEEKKRYADFLIDTSAGFDATRREVTNVYRQLQRIAAGDGQN
ncbi:MAG TPA: dephospho-CoA kinase [Pyrinomonadaceae bacterium]|nr:dephospho-CoA kinase [Pyrinomonadaceae bacterium]